MKPIEIYFANGVFIVSRKVLSAYLKVTPQQIIKYESTQYPTPLQRINNSEIGENSKKVFYAHIYAMMWHRDNIKHKFSPNESKYNGVSEECSGDSYDGNNITEGNMDIATKYEGAMNAQLKRKKEEIELKVLKGVYIPSEMSDKATAQIIRLLLVALRNTNDNMPKSLVLCDGIDEIKSVVDEAFSLMITDLREELEKYE